MKPLFKVCAVAKDEGPYLAEWVFHHLHFGFDLIHVYINRTSDASVAVLERIAQSHPQVTFEFIDWIDLCDPGVSAKLQTVAYAKDLEQSRQQNVDWLLFLDIDEFWVPKDFATSVDRFVAGICVDQQSQPICLLWHCELGQHAPFTPLQRGAGYELSSHLKTLIPLNGTDIKHVRIHHPIFGAQVTPLDAEGAPMVFNEQQPELASRSVMKPKSAYIIHRMYRSEKEYMALSLRGRPSQQRRLKMNRPGYRSHRNVSVRHRFFWPEDEFRDYDHDRKRFLEALDIESLITQDKAAILGRASRAVRMVKEKLDTPERPQAIAFLRGTRHAVVEGDETPAPTPTISQPVVAEAQPQPEPRQSEPLRPEPLQSEPLQSEPLQSEPLQSEPLQSEPLQSEPLRPEPLQFEPLRPEPPQSRLDAVSPTAILPADETKKSRSWLAVLIGWFTPSTQVAATRGSDRDSDRR